MFVFIVRYNNNIDNRDVEPEPYSLSGHLNILFSNCHIPEGLIYSKWLDLICWRDSTSFNQIYTACANKTIYNPYFDLKTSFRPGLKLL